MNSIKGFMSLLLGLLLSCPALLHAQTYGNEWVQYDQQYLRLKVGADGIYKLSFDEIQQAGFPVDQINPRTLQLFHRGQEQAIYVEGEADEVFNAEDFLLFYGRKNDGVMDKELYLTPGLQPHQYHNLYSDTTAYYLSFRSDGSTGRRMAFFNEANTANLSPEAYYWDEKLSVFTSHFYSGARYGYPGGKINTSLSYGDEGEGWFGPAIAGKVVDFPLAEITDTYTAGPSPELKMQLIGANIYTDRKTPVLAGPNTTSLSLLHTAVYSNFKAYTVQENLPWSAIANSQTIVRVSATASERFAVSYIRLRYPRMWNMGNQVERTFRLSASASSRYVEIENVPADVALYDISDRNRPIRVAYQREGKKIKAMLPASGAAEQVLLLSGIQQSAAANGKIFSFRKLPNTGLGFVIVSHQKLMSPAEGYNDPVRAYAAYRNSAAGGGHDTLVVEMQELYDQFSYGEYSPMAIRRFVEYISQADLPKYLFLLGKGLEMNYGYYRKTTWNSIYRDLVPTFGWPGADIPFVAQLKGSGYAPAFPVGRYSARTPEDVVIYLNKVIEDETVTPKSLWLKRIVHLGGGGNPFEGQQLRLYLKRLENIAVGPQLGASVTSVTKTQDVVVQEVDISKYINEGSRLVTFFGHSGAQTTDVEIGLASDPKTGYNNKGYYPRFLINGCWAGNAFGVNSNNNFWIDDWMYVRDKGALNFIAHVGIGYTTLLNQYSTYFYQVAAADPGFIGSSIGTVQQEAIKRFLLNGTQTPIQIAQAQQMLLQGDPALLLFDTKKSDFETNDELLSIQAMNNQPLNMTADSISVAVVVRNLGRAVVDSLQIQLEYWLDQNAPKTLDMTKVPPVFHQDTLYFNISTTQLDGPGISNFKLTLNPSGDIAESDYTNNTGSLQVLLPAGGTLNVLPHNYAVIKTEQLRLIAQGSNILYPSRGYELKLDTAYNFASTSLQQTTIQAKTLAPWQVQLPEAQFKPADTIVYYWKSRLATPGPKEDPSYARSSFTYIKDAPEGWAQAHEGQFSENKLSSLSVTEKRKWSFVPLERTVKVTTWGSNAAGMSYKDVEVEINGVQQHFDHIFRTCSNHSINTVVFDKNTLANKEALNKVITSPESCGGIPQIINNFVAGNIIYGDNDGYNLERHLKEVSEGDWVLLFSIGTNNYSQWPVSVQQQVKTLGIDPDMFSKLVNGEPLIILGKKGGAPGSALVVMADKSSGSLPADQQIIQMNSSVTGAPGIGFVESPLIGPAASWQDLTILMKESTNDHWSVEVVGVNVQEQESSLMKVSESGTLPLQFEASQYPYLRLRMQMIDTATLTPPQLRFWRVGFESLPEGVLLASDTLKDHYRIKEGSMFTPGFKFVNISGKKYAADSLEVVSSFLNIDKRSASRKDMKILAPVPGDTIRFGLPIETVHKTGSNNLQLKVNPRPGTEVTLANNVLDARDFFNVLADSLHPFIDVAFDGSYITNGEIVRPRPLISVIMRDENKVRLKQDTTGIHLSLKKECEGCVAQRVNLNNPSVRFYPATKQEDCKIEFTPEQPLEDGFYTLQVQAEDASGNKAGTKPYSISFEVVSETSITNFYPYPNPFSTSTRFVFTLTGNEVPDDLKIQIMTVSGKVIREIMKEELGLKIGHNISQYAWDGTDEWGDRLANGVYLYRVVIGGNNANEWKHRATKGDKAFKQQFGKLYILR